MKQYKEVFRLKPDYLDGEYFTRMSEQGWEVVSVDYRDTIIWSALLAKDVSHKPFKGVINLNDRVEFELTDAGRKCYTEYWADIFERENGIVPFPSSDQLHSVMHIFGPKIGPPFPPVFHRNNLRIV